MSVLSVQKVNTDTPIGERRIITVADHTQVARDGLVEAGPKVDPNSSMSVNSRGYAVSPIAQPEAHIWKIVNALNSGGVNLMTDFFFKWALPTGLPSGTQFWVIRDWNGVTPVQEFTSAGQQAVTEIEEVDGEADELILTLQNNHTFSVGQLVTFVPTINKATSPSGYVKAVPSTTQIHVKFNLFEISTSCPNPEDPETNYVDVTGFNSLNNGPLPVQFSVDTDPLPEEIEAGTTYYLKQGELNQGLLYADILCTEPVITAELPTANMTSAMLKSWFNINAVQGIAAYALASAEAVTVRVGQVVTFEDTGEEVDLEWGVSANHTFTVFYKAPSGRIGFLATIPVFVPAIAGTFYWSTDQLDPTGGLEVGAAGLKTKISSMILTVDDPEGVTNGIGQPVLAVGTDGSLWFKPSGTGNTGWTSIL